MTTEPPMIPSNDAIMLLLNQILENIKDNNNEIKSIKDHLVGVENCRLYRRDFQEQISKMGVDVEYVKRVCNEYGAEKQQFVDSNELETAKSAVRSDADTKIESMQNDIRDIKEAQLKQFAIMDWSFGAIKASWGKIAAVASIVWVAIMVTWGRGYNVYDNVTQYGPDPTIFIFLVTLTVLIGIFSFIYILYKRTHKQKN